jgi:cyclic pyranopterin phosphate synthase
MVLIDSFGRSIENLRLSVTDRCDFRCFYCIPKGFNDFAGRDQHLTLEETVRLVRLFSELGVSRVRLTGGEPLIRSDLPELAGGICSLPEVDEVSLSTNASRLAAQAQALRHAGIERINVSLDTLQPDTFRQITGSELQPVLDGLQAARAAGFRPIKINMVVMRDLNLHEVGDMVDYCLHNRFTLRFIETMPVGEAGRDSRECYVSMQEVQQILSRRFALQPARMQGSGPATYLKVKNQRLKIGFITPMSQHFCDTCNRVRLSAEGTLYLCLGEQDRVELRPLLRSGASDEALKQAIREAVQRKPKEHRLLEPDGQIARAMSVTGG